MLASTSTAMHTRHTMSVEFGFPGDPAPQLEASRRYFAEELPDSEPGEILSGRVSLDEADFIFGAVLSHDHKNAVVVVDAYAQTNDAALIQFPESFEPAALFRTCLLNALAELYPDMLSELAGVKEVPQGFKLFASLREYSDEDDEQFFLENIEALSYPIPLDRSQPTYAYLFERIGYGGYEQKEQGVGAVIFATGLKDGQDGIPPYWVYTSPASGNAEELEDE
ncbi:MAG: hypothetical protein JWM81_108 [Candidatus Saccharibacteria bacterium]|nr:hypothetical protein [Candidatus Saccharibacteria bacterium]